MDAKRIKLMKNHEPDDFELSGNLLVNETIQVLTSVGHNLCGLLTNFGNPPAFIDFGTELEVLQKEAKLLRENIDYLIKTQLFGVHKVMANVCSEKEDYKAKYHNLQNEWDDQQEHLGRLQNENYKLRNQLIHQGQFCASLGAIMGSLVWKSSRNPEVVDLLLSGQKLVEFTSIVNGTLVSFLETYMSHMPSQNTDESQFIMSMCGIITNVAANPSGRQFLMTNPNGTTLMELFIDVLTKIPIPSGNCLKRLILMAIYNLSINQKGLKFLQERIAVVKGLSHSFQKDTTLELKTMSMRLLQSITYDVACPDLLKNIEQNISTDLIEEMSKGVDTHMKITATDVLANLERARKVVNALLGPTAGNGPSNDLCDENTCYFQ